jgi:hypothetical protein
MAETAIPMSTMLRPNSLWVDQYLFFLATRRQAIEIATPLMEVINDRYSEKEGMKLSTRPTIVKITMELIKGSRTMLLVRKPSAKNLNKAPIKEKIVPEPKSAEPTPAVSMNGVPKIAKALKPFAINHR